MKKRKPKNKTIVIIEYEGKPIGGGNWEISSGWISPDKRVEMGVDEVIVENKD